MDGIPTASPIAWPDSGAQGDTDAAPTPDSGDANASDATADDSALPSEASAGLPDATAALIEAGTTSWASCSDDASTCVLPTSVCLDSWHLLFFVNPRCVGGSCQADVRSITCFMCANGACTVSPTR
jgi:hypothetical protein